jgi:hypothetical protein
MGAWNKIFKWLDNQEHKSMVFVVFGSENRLIKDHVYEIAYGVDVGFTRYIHNESNKF